MASSQAQAVIEMFRTVRETTVDVPASVEEQRVAAEGLSDLTAEPVGVRYTEVDVSGVPGLWLDPRAGLRDRVLLYLHGGGYMCCSIASHRKLVGHVATAVGCRALLIGYRRAPENPYPAALEDATAAYQWLLGEGYQPPKIALCGDSAGGGLAMAMLVKLRDEAASLPAACVALSPWVDLEAAGERTPTKADVDMLVTPDGLKRGRDNYLQGGDPRNPLASPVYASLTGLPPLYVQVGDHEVLLDDSTRLVANAQRDGVAARLDVFPEMQHVFQVSAGNVPEADDAVDRVSEWLRPLLGIDA